MVTELLGALAGMNQLARDRGIVDIHTAIEDDPIVGPVLFIRGRRLTARDLSAAAQLIREGLGASQDVVAFNQRHVTALSVRVLELSEAYPDLATARDNLRRALETSCC